MKTRVITFSATIIVLITIGLLFWKLQKADAGICSRTGASLDEEQLRRNVIISLVNNQLDIIRHQEVEYAPGMIKLGVVSEISDLDVAEWILDLNNGNDHSVSSFSPRTMRRVSGSQDVDLKKEPFVLLTYTLGKDASVKLIASQEIKQVKGVDRTFGGTKTSVLDRLRGFGNHYYQILSHQFLYDCCAEESANGTAARGSAVSFYKRGDQAGSVVKGNIGGVAIVSNCGDILTYEDERGFNRIKWIKGEE